MCQRLDMYRDELNDMFKPDWKPDLVQWSLNLCFIDKQHHHVEIKKNVDVVYRLNNVLESISKLGTVNNFWYIEKKVVHYSYIGSGWEYSLTM